jgi:hypothetical protein
MSKYRFKTEEEFKRDGLWDKYSPVKWVSSMNYYLGKDVPEKFNRDCDYEVAFHYNCWAFSSQDYVLKEVQSEYTKGKWYGCKRWSSKMDFVKLTKAVDDQAYFTECINNGEYQNEKENWWAFVGDSLFEADMSIISPLLPDGHPDKIVTKESSFVLPEKWCIKVERNSQPKEVRQWRGCDWKDGGYINRSGAWLPRPHSGYTEITFEQFKQYVLTPSDVVKTLDEEHKQEEKIDMRAIQEEAKRRFPIGCKYISASLSTGVKILSQDRITYSIYGDMIYAHDLGGLLYINGRWAKRVEDISTQYIPTTAQLWKEDPLKLFSIEEPKHVEKKPVIDDVQSVNVTLRTKKKRIKF